MRTSYFKFNHLGFLITGGILFFPFFSSPTQADFFNPFKKLACINDLKKPPPPLDPGNGEIAYTLYGKENSKTVVLIHGLDSAQYTFANIIPELSKKYRVLVYDQRGHGATVARGFDYSSSTMAHDLNALLDFLGIEKATILGHSMGGRTAVRFSELYPGKTEGLIIEDMELTPRRAPLTETEQKDLEKKSLELELQFQNKKFKTRAELIEALKPLYGNEAESISYRRAKENPDGTLSVHFRPHVSILYGSQGNTEDLMPALKIFRKPALVLRSDPRMGTAISKDGLTAFQTQTPHVQVEFIRGSGHVIHRTHPEPFLTLVDDFLDHGKISPELKGKYGKSKYEPGEIDLEAIFKIEDPKKRVAELSELDLEVLTPTQIQTLITHAPALTNSFEMGQFLRLASEAKSEDWLPVINQWIKSWTQNEEKIAWKIKMKETAEESQLEIIDEAFKNNPLSQKISVEYAPLDAKLADKNMLPLGGAILSDSGALKNQGITAIIHAGSGSMTEEGLGFDPTLQSVGASVFNSIRLAQKNGYKRIAVPFIGGKVFADRIGVAPEKIAQAIVRAALKAKNETEICFVLFGNEDVAIFGKIINSLPHDATTRVEVFNGSITQFTLHRAPVIVNAANTEAQFGGGLSGVIGRGTQMIDSIDRENARLIREFNQFVKKLQSL